jgi:hypothetical protein
MTKSMKEPPQLIFVHWVDGDVIVQCPNCSHTGPLMQDFSLLRAGFNGIKRDEPDDCDLQECGCCNGRFQWDNIPVEEAE